MLLFRTLYISSRAARFVINVYAQPGPWVEQSSPKFTKQSKEKGKEN